MFYLRRPVSHYDVRPLAAAAATSEDSRCDHAQAFMYQQQQLPHRTGSDEWPFKKMQKLGLKYHKFVTPESVAKKNGKYEITVKCPYCGDNITYKNKVIRN